MAFDWKGLERQDARKVWWALLTVGSAAAVLGLVSMIWGAVAVRSDRLIDGAIQLAAGLVVVGIAAHLRGRTKPEEQ